MNVIYAEIPRSNCSICDCSDKKLVIDHCHRTLKIRGFLCKRCNMRLSLFEANRTVLRPLQSDWIEQFQDAIAAHLRRNYGRYCFTTDRRAKDAKLALRERYRIARERYQLRNIISAA